MTRELDNWLTGYMEYTEQTESAKIFHTWTGLSMLSSALRKKVWFNFGRFKVYCNMYVVLVAEPGTTRKTQAISYGTRILNEVSSIITSADVITREALLEDLEESADDAQLEDGKIFKHASLSVISREFESFLGQKKENTKMLVLLTDLFDCEELPFKYRTKRSGSNVAPAVFFNILGATTPESLASCLPSIAIGGGLTSRTIYVWADDKDHKVPIPEMSPEIEAVKVKLIKDLSAVSRIVGEYNFSKDSKKEWINWYNQYEERDPKRLCTDYAFHSWYSRKPLYIIKLAVILTAAISDSRIVEWAEFKKAITLMEDIERSMGKAFCAVGRSDITADVAEVRTIIESYHSISEKMLMHLVWRNIDSAKFNNVIDTVLKSGVARRSFTGPKGQQEVWYHWED